jgi:hypothetical protein
MWVPRIKSDWLVVMRPDPHTLCLWMDASTPIPAFSSEHSGGDYDGRYGRSEGKGVGTIVYIG